MKITDILHPPLVMIDITSTDKDDVLRSVAAHLSRNAPTLAHEDPAEILDALRSRERLGSTGVGEGVAIPHAKIPGLTELVACFGRIPKGVSFDAIDQQPVKLVFVLLVPENSAGAHLKALARISRLLKNPAFRQRLLSLPTREAVYQAFVDEDAQY